MKRWGYDPIGCSKSIKLEKVRLRKRLYQKEGYDAESYAMRDKSKQV